MLFGSLSLRLLVMLVLDCETDRSLAEAGYAHCATFQRSAAERAFEYHRAVRRLRPTVVVCYDTDTRELFVSVPDAESEGPPPEWRYEHATYNAKLERGYGALWARLDKATCLCGWNVAFDLNVLSAACDTALTDQVLCAWSQKAVDPMLTLARHTGKFLSLQDAVTLNPLCGGGEPAPPALQHTARLLGDQWESGKPASGLQAIRWHQDGEWTQLVTYCCVDVLLTVQIALRSRVNVPVDLRLHSGPGRTREVSCQTPTYWTRTTG